MSLEYAPQGYCFARVSTPSAFLEYLLPVTTRWSAEDIAHQKELEKLAEKHATSVYSSAYRVG